MSSQPIAVVGVSCRYPDAASPAELWENVLAGRRAFRKLPPERMPLDSYYSPDPAAPDRFYSMMAAVIEGFEFDRVRYRVAGSTYRATDMTHWLALDTAGRALADAGFEDGAGLPRRSTGVIIGNTLTGEFSRASIMRLRWPYVRRAVGSALRDRGWDDASLTGFLAELEDRYKAPFPSIDEDSLAGGLSNTIAGRICNHFDLAGGGYTVDGACSSSLLSVTTACNALSNGELDAAIVGGVDLSIDPFEIIGFAKTGALASSEMLVYDKKSNGFWPGEGCGMLVLMRAADAHQQGLRSYATIAGWGYSSDGRGGITRPEAAGHLLAIERAYRVAGFGIDSVGYLEGHGTGTAVGDTTELKAFSQALRSADPDLAPVPISTLKGNIGHTKAAAGVGGLLKAILAVHHQLIPPATGNTQPHPELTGDRPALRIPVTAELFPAGRPIRVGVSSMGFGGINTHVVLEQAASDRASSIDPGHLGLTRSRQDCELLLLDADSNADLRGKVAQLHQFVGRISIAECGDLAATLQAELADRPFRAAVVVTGPVQAEKALAKLLSLLDSGARTATDPGAGVFLDSRRTAPRIGFLFPGQGVGRRGDGGALRQRFAEIDEFYRARPLPEGADLVDTAVAQPRIVTSSIAGLRVLSRLGIEAVAAAGHSLGELTALHWAGGMDENTLLSVAGKRGRIMSQRSAGAGAMANLVVGAESVASYLQGTSVVIAGYNGRRQTVVSGAVDEVALVCRKAEADGITVMPIAVSHAFHSELVAPAAEVLAAALVEEQFGQLKRPVISTVTGQALSPEADLIQLLTSQVRQPVRFTEAIGALAHEVDLLIEVGPGKVLSQLATETLPGILAMSMETDSLSLAGLLRTVAAAFVMGAPVRYSALVDNRFSRPLPLDKDFGFFINPCEAGVTGQPALPAAEIRPAVGWVPAVGSVPAAVPAGIATVPAPVPAGIATVPAAADLPLPAGTTAGSAIEVLRRLAAERAELPLATVRPDSHPLDELHLSSIAVGQLVNQASRELGVPAPVTTSAYATSTLSELAEMLDLLGQTTQAAESAPADPAGVRSWVRAFGISWLGIEPPPMPSPGPVAGRWELFADQDHPLGRPLQDGLQRAGIGDGILLCLPPEGGVEQVPLMLTAARAAIALPAPARFVVVGDRRGAAGLAKTLHLEAPTVRTTVVSLPLAEPTEATLADTVRAIVADVAATADFSEIRYDAAGHRRQPVLRPLELAAGELGMPLSRTDVLLVTGGGKGITAECALALARTTGAAVGLLGRSDPAQDPELAANLRRLTAAGVRHHYHAADVTSRCQVQGAIAAIEESLGPVTAVLHGAGRNEPRPLTSLDEETFRDTLAPKLDGLQWVLAGLNPGTLRLLVSFGSIIGRAGLRGEAHYATANSWLTELTAEIQRDHPDCRCLALEWSVWSGSGMGERLGVLESLVREGITPIPTEAGIQILQQILADPSTPTEVVVMGRAAGLPTISLEPAEPPLLRFLDRVQTHYPGVEIVADTELSANGDLYLADHLLDGDLLFPAVLGMEAMAQAAGALTGRADPPTLSEVRFLRPIVVPPDGSITLRIAALQESTGTVEVVLRSSETSFLADHFHAKLHYPQQPPTPVVPLGMAGPRLPLDPMGELYGRMLFQGGRFRRLLGYRQLSATGCVAELSHNRGDDWFGGYLPHELVLADPGTRDAVMHSIQSCVPDATLLPAGIERLCLADPKLAGDAEQLTMSARERWRDGDTYLYDVDVYDPAGSLVEQWLGLRLQAVRKQDGTGPWLPALLGSYLQRRLEEVLGQPLRCAVQPDPDAGSGITLRRARTASALAWATGTEVAVSYRPDGKPELIGGPRVSSAHGPGLTFAVAADTPVACDVELAFQRDKREWTGLLGADGLWLSEVLSSSRQEPLTVTATRVWTAIECLRKMGHANVDTLTGGEPRNDHWMVLRAGNARIATLATNVHGLSVPLVFAVLIEEEK
ncbi:MAG: SDR family NAD(P)-dependent oxidoreductase [Jatrophihabitantaceae bacterium]